MAKTLPCVAIATFCERVLVEKDEVVSAIRLVDQSHVEVPEELRDGDIPPFQLRLLVGLKSCGYKGAGKLVIQGRAPDGQTIPELYIEAALTFHGGNHGTNLNVQIPIPYRGDGLYWFDVQFEGELLTRVPLKLSMSRTLSQSQGTPGPSVTKH
jgi:hypothetical protein